MYNAYWFQLIGGVWSTFLLLLEGGYFSPSGPTPDRLFQVSGTSQAGAAPARLEQHLHMVGGHSSLAMMVAGGLLQPS